MTRTRRDRHRARTLPGAALFALCAYFGAPAGAIAAEAYPTTSPTAATRDLPTAVTPPAERVSIDEAAAQWGLSPAEYQRYLAALGGMRGRISDPRITPIEVLGIEARSDAERRRYAEMWVETMLADTEKVLAYSREVQDAWDRLHPGAPLIDPERVDAFRTSRGSPFAPLAGRRRETGRLIVFTRVDCKACDGKVRQVLQLVRAGEATGADLYLLDLPRGQDDKIRGWARALPVPPDRVGDGTITLNYDDGQLQQAAAMLQLSPGTIPFVVSRSPSGALTTVLLAGD